jgi:hypothetical protein
MDGSRFDSLTRSLNAAISRRRAVGGLLSGSLSLLGWGSGPDAAAHDLLPGCKKKKGKQKKKCLKKARKHNLTHTTAGGCTPSCAGKNCGLDGCGGLCGPCNDGTCTDGTCVCRDGEELCQDRCVPVCPQGCARIPGSCGSCCSVIGNCSSGPCFSCCGQCSGGTCIGRALDAFCEFDAQCFPNVCTDGTCRCPSGQERCGHLCLAPCPEDQVRVPGSCRCCITNGPGCDSTSTPCCEGVCDEFRDVCRAV